MSRRFGFVKLALQQGAALVPAYAFGTVDLYEVTPAQHEANASGLLWALHRRLGVALPRYSGSLGFVPRRVPVDLVVGAPLALPFAALETPGQPTDAEVRAAHGAYVAALRLLFDAHKGALGYGDRELVVT